MEVKCILVRQWCLLFLFVCVVHCTSTALGQSVGNVRRNRAQISAGKFDNIYTGPREKRTLDILLKGLADALGYELRPRKLTTNTPTAPAPVTASPTQSSVPAPPSPTRPATAEGTTAKGTNDSGGNDLVAVKETSQTPSNEDASSNTDEAQQNEQLNVTDENSEIANYYRNNAGDHFRSEYDRIRGFDGNGNQVRQQNDGENQGYNEGNVYDQPWNVQLYNQYSEVPDDEGQSQTKRDEEKFDGGYYNYQIPPPSTQPWENLYYFGNDGAQSNNFQSTSDNPSYDYGKLLQYSFDSPQAEQQYTDPTAQYENTEDKDEANKNQPSGGGNQINFIPNPEFQSQNGGKISDSIQNSISGKLPIASTSQPKMAQILHQSMEGSKQDGLWPAPFHYTFNNGNNAAAPTSQQQLLKNDAVIGEKAQLLINYNPGANSLSYAAPEDDKTSSQNLSGKDSNSNQNTNNAGNAQQNTKSKAAGNRGKVVSSEQIPIPQNSYSAQGQNAHFSQPILGAISSQDQYFSPPNEQIFLSQYLTPPQDNPSVNYFNSPQLITSNLAPNEDVPQKTIQQPSTQQASSPQNANVQSQTTTSREFGAYAALFIPHTAFGKGFSAIAERLISASPTPLTGLFVPNNNNQGKNREPSPSLNLPQFDELNHLRNDRHASPNIPLQAEQNNVKSKTPVPPNDRARLQAPESQRNSRIQQGLSRGDPRGTSKLNNSPPPRPLPAPEKKQNPPPSSPAQGEKRDQPYYNPRFPERRRIEGRGDDRYHDDYLSIPNYRFDATERLDQGLEEKDEPSYWKSYSYDPPEPSRQFYKVESSDSPERSHEHATFSVLSPLTDDYTNLDYYYDGNQKEDAHEEQQHTFQRRSDELQSASPTAAKVEDKTVHWGLMTIPPPTEYKEPAGLGDNWEAEQPKSTGRTITKETISRVSKDIKVVLDSQHQEIAEIFTSMNQISNALSNQKSAGTVEKFLNLETQISDILSTLYKLSNQLMSIESNQEKETSVLEEEVKNKISEMHYWLSELSDRFSCREDDLVRKFEESARVQITNLESCITDLSEKLSEFKASTKSDEGTVSNKISKLESNVQEIGDKLGHVQEGHKSEDKNMISQLGEIHSCVIQLMEEVTSKDALLLDQNAQVSDIYQCVTQISDKIISSKSDHPELETKIDHLNSSTSHLMAKMKQWDSQFRSQDDQVSEIKTCVSQMRSDLKTLMENSPKDLVLTAQISEIHSSLNDLISKLGSQDQKAEKQNVEISQVCNSIHQLSEKVSSLLARPDDQSLKIKINEIHVGITDLSERLLTQEVKLNKQNTQSGKIHSDILELSENVTDISSRLNDLNFKTEVENLTTSVAQSLKEAKTLSFLLNKQSSDLSEMYSCLTELQTIVRSTKEDKSLKTMLMDMQSNIVQIPELIINRPEHFNLRHQISEIHNNIFQLMEGQRDEEKNENLLKAISLMSTSVNNLEHYIKETFPNNENVIGEFQNMHLTVSQLKDSLKSQDILIKEQADIKAQLDKIVSLVSQHTEQLKKHLNDSSVASQTEQINSSMPQLLSENLKLRNQIEELSANISRFAKELNVQESENYKANLFSKMNEMQNSVSHLIERLKERDTEFNEVNLTSKIMEIHTCVHKLMEENKISETANQPLMSKITEMHSLLSQFVEDARVRGDDASLKSKVEEIYLCMPQIMDGLKAMGDHQDHERCVGVNTSSERCCSSCDLQGGVDPRLALGDESWEKEDLISQLAAENQRRQRAELLLDEAQGKLDVLEAAYERSSELARREMEVLNARVVQLAEGVAREQKNVLRLNRGRAILLRQLKAAKATLAEERAGHGSSAAQLSAHIKAHHQDQKQLQDRLFHTRSRYRRRIASVRRSLGSRSAKIERLRAAMIKLGELCHSIEHGYQKMLREMGEHILDIADLLSPILSHRMKTSPFPEKPSQLGMWFVQVRTVALRIKEVLQNDSKLSTVAWCGTTTLNDHLVVRELSESSSHKQCNQSNGNKDISSHKNYIAMSEMVSTSVSHYNVGEEWEKLVKSSIESKSETTKDLKHKEIDDKCKSILNNNHDVNMSSKYSTNNSDFKTSATLDFTSSLTSYMTVKNLKKEAVVNAKRSSTAGSVEELSVCSVGTLDTEFTIQESSDTANIVASSLSEDVLPERKETPDHNLDDQDEQRFLQNRFVAILEGLKQKLLQIDPISDLQAADKNSDEVKN